MIKEIKIPDIAENVDTGLIAAILVAEGDMVKVDQALVEVETDKATTEIPSDYDGTIKEIKVNEGDEVKVNQVIIILEVSDTENNEDDKAGKIAEKPEKEEEQKDTDEKELEEKQDTHNEQEEKENKASEKDKKDQTASPLAKKIARENNVNMAEVEGSGPGNRVSKSDIENFIEQRDKSSQTQDKKGPGFIEQGAVTKKPMNNIGKITAKTMLDAWQSIPHVTQFDEADITNLEEFRKQNQEKIEKHGGKLTITAILLKIAGFALQKFAVFNSSLDWENQEIIYKNYYNISVAVDTPQGLLVPVVRDVNKKSLLEIAVELTELAKKARNKKISPDELQGGNFTISNLGGIGGTGFTPIVYPPQVAILGVSRAKYKQVFMDDTFKKRLVIPLSLSYDHRVINGADGARFLRWICDVIEDPYALFY
ncbi:MAG: 2-oxo acid dehydrogenase subunit E2 [Bacteroidales bacterium]|nr:2-oxo acid dehydrogenase subunit E2 [Bacteroidales bacterium]